MSARDELFNVVSCVNEMVFWGQYRYCGLCSLSPDPSSQLDVLRHDCDPFRVDCAQVSVFKESDQVGLTGFLQTQRKLNCKSSKLSVTCNTSSQNFILLARRVNDILVNHVHKNTMVVYIWPTVRQEFSVWHKPQSSSPGFPTLEFG